MPQDPEQTEQTEPGEPGDMTEPVEPVEDPPLSTEPIGPEPIPQRRRFDKAGSFSDRLDTTEPDHPTMMEAFRYGWNNGERKFMIAGAITIAVIALIAVVMAAVFVKDVRVTHSTPYETVLPVEVLDRVPGYEGPATNTGSVTVSIDGCNTTDDVLLLSIRGHWVKFAPSPDDENGVTPAHLIPAQFATGIAALPSGVNCGDSGPTVTRLPLPDEVVNDPGKWQANVQVVVRKCNDHAVSQQLGAQVVGCTQPGEVVDRVGWFSEIFEVVPSSGTTEPDSGEAETSQPASGTTQTTVKPDPEGEVP